jgi:5-oxoprolinase (ATP-hydrolysing)
LEWVTWGGGGLGDPTTRPAEKVALEVARKIVTVKGAKDNYGVVVKPRDYSVDEEETKACREKIVASRDAKVYNERVDDRGGSLAELMATCLEETGLPPPKAQWVRDPYGAHVALAYVKECYKTMREKEE